MTTTTYNFEEKDATGSHVSLVSGVILGMMFVAALFFMYSFFALFLFGGDVAEKQVETKREKVHVEKVNDLRTVSIFSSESEDYPALKAEPYSQ